MKLLPQGPDFLVLWCFNNEAVLDSPAEAVMFKWPSSSACFSVCVSLKHHRGEGWNLWVFGLANKNNMKIN